MKISIPTATIVLMFAVSPALAQERELKTYPKTSRPYIGLLVGYDQVKLSADGLSGDKANAVYAGFVGFETDLGERALLAFEAEAAGSLVKATANDLLEDGDSARISAGRDLYAGLKLGFRAAPSFVLYAKGGYTNVQVKGRYSDLTDSGSESVTNGGYRVGAGVEYGTGPVHLIGEYRYSDYGRFKYEDLDLGIKGRRNQVVAGVKYGF